MLFDLFRMGSLDSDARMQLIINLGVRIFIIFCVLPIHEFAHAWMANKLGDPTARLKGRLTINPMAHIDPIGALLIVFAGFGYAKPVPVNPRNFKSKKNRDDNIIYMGSTTDTKTMKRGMAITALAGPISNLIMAAIFLMLMNITGVLGSASSRLALIIYWFFMYSATININLAVFNLIPIPPLDGSRLLSAVLPDKAYFKLMQYEGILRYVIFALIIFNILTIPLSYLSGWIYSGLNYIIGLPFHLLLG